MKTYIREGDGRKLLPAMTYMQSKQAIAIMDCIGRLIPQEGVDYEIEVTFKGEYDPSVSMGIVPLTDKGEFWKKYAMEMIKKYPPTVDNPKEAIPEDPAPDPGDSNEDPPSQEEVSKDAPLVP